MLLQHLPTYLGGLPKVGSKCGAWPESGWPVDQVMMGLAFFSALLGICPVSGIVELKCHVLVVSETSWS